MKTGPTYKVFSVGEIMALPPDPDIKKVVVDDGWITLNFQYPYEIDLNRISTPLHLVNWVAHLCGKTWMTRDRVYYFVEAVCKAKRWKIHGPL